MSQDLILHTSDADFDKDVLEASAGRPVLVDFWAEWCGPCKSLAPLLETLAHNHASALQVVKLDTDQNVGTAERYGIRSLPTLLLFVDGKVVEQIVGAQPLSALEDLVGRWLPRAGDSAIQRAQAALADDEADREAAIVMLEQALEADSGDFRIHAVLGELYLATGRVDDARGLVRELPANISTDDAFNRLHAKVHLASASDAFRTVDDSTGQAFRAAIDEAIRGRPESAVPALLELLPAHRDWADGAIRKTLVDLFNILEDDPRLRDWRGQMARALH